MWPFKKRSDAGPPATPPEATASVVDKPQKIWDDYYDRIKRRRMAEAELLWAKIETAGATADTAFALDFSHFSNALGDADYFARQLSEHYDTQVVARSEPNYWDIKGTTRPERTCLTKAQHLAWVEFMADVAASYACVFSEWTLEAPALGLTFQSADLDAD
jgi:hypothetical protein